MGGADADTPGIGPLRTAELMASRTGVRAVEPSVAPTTGFVVERLTDKNDDTVGEITTNPISGRTEIMLVALNPATGETEGVMIPFADRVDAFHAIEEFYDTGPPTIADLKSVEEVMIQLLEITDLDEFLKRDN